MEEEDDDEEEETERKPRKRRDVYDEKGGKLTPAERRHRALQFQYGMWGAKLIFIAFTLQAFALLLVVAFLAYHALAEPSPAILLAAGVLGLLNWLTGAVGLGLCLAGRPSPGHYEFGGAAAVAALIHLAFLGALLVRHASGLAILGVTINPDAAIWSQLPTRLDSLTLYLLPIAYPDDQTITGRVTVLALLTGVAELVRLVLITMTLSCMAKAAGDEELVHRCTRAGGIGSLGPGGLALAMLVLFVTLNETGGMNGGFGAIVMSVFVMGTYAILAGMLVPSIVAAREVADACEAPFLVQKLDLGSG